MTSSEPWAAVRTAVAEAGDRFGDLVTSAGPATMATADWTVADVAAHVASIAWQYTSMTGAEGAPPPMLEADVPTVTVDTVGAFNDLTMRHFTERDPAVLTTGLRADIDRILRATERRDPTEPVPWLGGARVPLQGVFAHLLNELLIHGWDIAKATGAPWPIPPREAALFFELFFVGVIRGGAGRLLDTEAPPQQRIAVEFRSRYTTPVTIAQRAGEVSVDKPGEAVDIRLAFDPPTLNLMMFGRVSRARAALTGKVRVWGRRPWLLPAFLRVVRTP